MLARNAGLYSLLLTALGCGSKAHQEQPLQQPAVRLSAASLEVSSLPSATSVPIQAQVVPRRRSVCLTGAGGHRTFESFCESTFVAGRIDDCRNGPCHSTFSTFPIPNADSVWKAVFDTLDTTRDGKLNAEDERVELDVIGYSWGGVNAVDLAARMAADERVAPPWRVTRLILLDAFQPGASLSIPDNVDRTFSFRHSVAPPNDCSSGALLGPYLGIAPTCAPSQACFDFDFSQSPEQRFGAQRGKSVGHCDVPRAALAAIKQLLRDEEPTAAPQGQSIKPLD
jgi:pimeloyl-ACP methyl ester carboxylesterase